MVAIGEAGLDYHYDNSPREAQEQGFRAHIAAARETGLPLVIHAREADEDVANILRSETKKGAFPAVLHCFTGGRELAFTGIELGLYVSFTGILTYKNAAPIRAAAKAQGLDRFMLETDAHNVARLLDRLFWLAWVGLGIITFVALRMIWDGSAQIIHQTAALSLLGS